MANLSMTNHPIHLHGVEFVVSCTDGGWVPEQAAWPEAMIDIGVGQIRAIDFVANVPGDWAIHCHKSHHTMNSMGHDVRTYIGADIKKASEMLKKLVPGYMPMGADQYATYDDRRRPVWAHRDGWHVHDVKVREGLSRGDFKDPGWHEYPRGSVAHEVKIDVVEEPVRPPAPESKRARGQAGHDARMKMMHE